MGAVNFHSDIAAQLPFFLAVNRKFISPTHPAWTAGGVTPLVPNNGITEIKLASQCRLSSATQ